MNDDTTPQGNSEWLQTYNLALEDRVNCDADECENEAVYFYKHQCCNTLCLGCDWHVSKVVNHLMEMQTSQAPVHCGYCGELSIPLRLITKPMKLKLDPDP